MEPCRLADAERWKVVDELLVLELLVLFSTCPNDTVNGPGVSMAVYVAIPNPKRRIEALFSFSITITITMIYQLLFIA